MDTSMEQQPKKDNPPSLHPIVGPSCGCAWKLGVDDKKMCMNYHAGWLCARPKGHTGDHVACTSRTHELSRWPNNQINKGNMNRHENPLTAKVAAQNEANSAGVKLYDGAVAALRPFVGAKIVKVDGTLLAKVKDALPVLPNEADLSAYYSVGHGYSLTLRVKTCHTSIKKTHDAAHYAEALVYLGDLQNGVLTKLYDKPNHRTDYTEQEIIQARVALRQAKDAMSKAQSALAEFGEHDL